MADQPCKVCKLIRYFMLVAVPLLVLIATRPDIAVPAIPIETLYTNFIVIAFACVLVFRIYKDYFKKKK
jgi:disulfide bond formation protein DsbB